LQEKQVEVSKSQMILTYKSSTKCTASNQSTAVLPGLFYSSVPSDEQGQKDLTLQNHLQVVPLRNADLLDPQRYPRFTLVGQALGSVRMVFCALKMLRPQVAFHFLCVGSLILGLCTLHPTPRRSLEVKSPL